MVTTKQDPMVDTQKIMRKESKHNIKESDQTTKEENNRRKVIAKQLTKWQLVHTYQ